MISAMLLFTSDNFSGKIELKISKNNGNGIERGVNHLDVFKKNDNIFLCIILFYYDLVFYSHSHNLGRHTYIKVTELWHNSSEYYRLEKEY